MNKKYQYDKESDSLYICIKEGEEDRYEEVVPGINVEYDDKDEIIGIEIIKASRFSNPQKKLIKLKQ